MRQWLDKPGVNNKPKYCPEPEFDLTVCNKVHAHTNTLIHTII